MLDKGAYAVAAPVPVAFPTPAMTASGRRMLEVAISEGYERTSGSEGRVPERGEWPTT